MIIMNRLNTLKNGMRDGMPIALGYLAVSFSLGIQAKSAGMSWLMATIMSFTNVTSAGQFAAIGIIAAGGSYVELALSTLIINLRYMLMSCSLSQKIDPKAPFIHRLFMAHGVTDEIFGISYGVTGSLSPYYTYGAMLVAIPGWCLGTLLGVVLGNILPTIVVSALSVALYGMFIAIIIPPAKKDKNVAIAIIIAMILGFIFTIAPYLKNISSGTRVIIITVIISSIFAIICPIKDDEEMEETNA